MLPVISIPREKIVDTKVVIYPSMTYGIDLKNKCIIGTIDGVEALKQSIIFNSCRHKGTVIQYIIGIMAPI